jgi:hypothetical protein
MRDPYEEVSVLKSLPNPGERVLAYGHHTYCCELDMDDEPDWHEVFFRFNIVFYRIKKAIPEDKGESILQEYELKEAWHTGTYHYDGHLRGVTKWKRIASETKKRHNDLCQVNAMSAVSIP